MSATDNLPVQVPSQGINGLAMMASMVGLPLGALASGAFVATGIGFIAFSSLVGPFAGMMIHAARSKAVRRWPLLVEQKDLESSLAAPVSDTVNVTTSDSYKEG